MRDYSPRLTAKSQKKRVAELEKQAAQKQAEVEKLDTQIAVKEKAKATIAEVEAMGKPTMLGSGFTVTADEMKKLKTLAKKSVNADKQIADSKKKMAALDEQIKELDRNLRDAQAEANHWHREYTDLKNEVKDFLRLVKLFPARVKEFFAGLFREEQAQAQQLESERQSQILPAQKKNKSHDYGR